jgi:hypothetical protein
LGFVQFWDIASDQRIGPAFTPFTPFANEVPRWIGFQGGERLVIDGRTQSAVLDTTPISWRRHACDLLAVTDPEGELSSSSQVQGLDPCP